jgi:hypothetical protein
VIFSQGKKEKQAMRKPFLIVLLSIFLCFPAIAQSFNGYGNAEWGDNIQAIRGIWPTLRDVTGEYPGDWPDEVSIFGYDHDGIRYFFFFVDGGFYKVIEDFGTMVISKAQGIYQMSVSKYGNLAGPTRNGLLIEYRNTRSANFAVTFVQTNNIDGDCAISLHIFNPRSEDLVKGYKYKMWEKEIQGY